VEPPIQRRLGSFRLIALMEVIIMCAKSKFLAGILAGLAIISPMASSGPAAAVPVREAKSVDCMSDCAASTTAPVALRSTPSLQGKKIATIPKGTTVAIYNYSHSSGKCAAWAFVSYRGKDGWVCHDYLNHSVWDDTAFEKLIR